MDALRAEFTSTEEVDSFEVDGVADMVDDGVLLRRGRFTGGRSGGPREGEAEGVNRARRGSVVALLLDAAAGIVAVVARSEQAAGTLLRELNGPPRSRCSLINASRQVPHLPKPVVVSLLNHYTRNNRHFVCYSTFNHRYLFLRDRIVCYMMEMVWR